MASPGSERVLNAKRKLLEKTFEALSQSLVVVEGKRDSAALEEAGITAETVLAVGKPESVVRRVLENAEGREVVLLTDFDGEGERKAQQLNEMLLAEGIRTEEKLRRDFRRLFGISCVEEMGTALERLQDELQRTKTRKKT